MAGVPFGTQLLINGNVYTVEDLGTPYGHVDIYFNSHSEALVIWTSECGGLQTELRKRIRPDRIKIIKIFCLSGHLSAIIYRGDCYKYGSPGISG